MNLSHNPVSPDRSADLRSGASLMIGNPPGRRPVCGRSADSLVRKFLSSGSRGLSGPRSGSVAQSAFSLVEIMIAVTLMSVIVLGLTAMFTQTQRAFRLGMNQSDVLEAGRIATDMIVREMETMVPVNRTNITPAFYSELESINNTSVLPLPGTPEGRTNWMSDVFFLKRENQTLTGVGYFVRTNADVPDSYDPVGSLYRYETNCSPWMFDQNPYRLSEGFYKARFVSPPIRSSKVVDGVVHFSVKAYDTNGV
ncbi:MAG TPA: prepilin-type N-terminal cleavage/methylation domain-containing protein, partial [Candidatus Paceibacterota bacterium]|nr:prepilin-type N-terminal cleavage/methylation domain-containing protein [Candidatus Paceibacterota bacterium]